ncbi:MAG: hypothetical protein L3K26_13420, partial [Candidatus Hydrogenedentes bacterium]|nr:hypothetical protein [Candidatus Hydrogenedentota bacterium]
VEVLFVNQAQDDLPEGFESCKGRSRPWGTAHALWCARHVIDGPLIVINADDFYGRDAYRTLAAALGENRHCHLAGYALGNTLSDHGGVSRGLIELDSAGWVQRVREALDLRADSSSTVQGNGSSEHVIGKLRQGEKIVVSRLDPISMNLWGFPPETLDDLGGRFERFLGNEPKPDPEFYLSQARGGIIKMERAQCSLLQTNAQWLGITFPEDHAGVVSALAELVAQAEYPGDLNGAWKAIVESR